MELGALNIPSWSCTKGLHSYANDEGIFVVAVVPEGGPNLPPTAQGWTKIEDGDGMATRVVFDRWGLFWGPEGPKPGDKQVERRAQASFHAAP
jgi:hypothetical protein